MSGTPTKFNHQTPENSTTAPMERPGSPPSECCNEGLDDDANEEHDLLENVLLVATRDGTGFDRLVLRYAASASAIAVTPSNSDHGAGGDAPQHSPTPNAGAAPARRALKRKRAQSLESGLTAKRKKLDDTKPVHTSRWRKRTFDSSNNRGAAANTWRQRSGLDVDSGIPAAKKARLMALSMNSPRNGQGPTDQQSNGRTSSKPAYKCLKPSVLENVFKKTGSRCDLPGSRDKPEVKSPWATGVDSGLSLDLRKLQIVKRRRDTSEPRSAGDSKAEFPKRQHLRGILSVRKTPNVFRTVGRINDVIQRPGVILWHRPKGAAVPPAIAPSEPAANPPPAVIDDWKDNVFADARMGQKSRIPCFSGTMAQSNTEPPTETNVQIRQSGGRKRGLKRKLNPSNEDETQEGRPQSASALRGPRRIAIAKKRMAKPHAKKP